MERTKHKHPLLFISSLALLISHQFSIASAQNATPSTVSVGVLLALGTSSGKRSKTSISMALEDFYAINGNFSTKIELKFRDSMNEVVSAASADVIIKVWITLIKGKFLSKTKIPLIILKRTKQTLKF
ncbi:Glutamate receptor [Rhynchospora pubera]|uniref:Glutamate receptor n=1 Tax=Rhynchospora pubera TaxID=906938 RepID=A0AAV8HKG5_9POAL|nr:Glutamate receptor [Rhynchospora pubera]